MNFENIHYSAADRVVTIRLNRPDAANGLNLEMATELAQAASLVSADDDVKAVVLSAEGRFFWRWW